MSAVDFDLTKTIYVCKYWAFGGIQLNLAWLESHLE